MASNDFDVFRLGQAILCFIFGTFFLNNARNLYATLSPSDVLLIPIANESLLIGLSVSVLGVILLMLFLGDYL